MQRPLHFLNGDTVGIIGYRVGFLAFVPAVLYVDYTIQPCQGGFADVVSVYKKDDFGGIAGGCGNRKAQDSQDSE